MAPEEQKAIDERLKYEDEKRKKEEAEKAAKKSIGKSSKGSLNTRDTERDSPPVGVGLKRRNKFNKPKNSNDDESSDDDPSLFKSVEKSKM